MSHEIKKALTVAFRALRKQGYTARQNFSCCSSCAWYELGDKGEKAVFYNRQSNATLEKYGEVYLQWSGDAAIITKALKDAGLDIEHDGTQYQAIYVKGLNNVG